MSLLTWAAVGLLLGLVMFLAAPILVAPRLSPSRQQGLLRSYSSLAMVALDRGGIIDLEGSGMTLKHFTYKHGREHFELGDEDHSVNDPHGEMGTFHKHAFGIVREGTDKIVSPVTAAIAEADKHAVEEYGEATTTYYQNDQGEVVDSEEQVLARVRVPDTTRLVDFSYIPEFLTHSADSQLPDTVDTYVKHSLSDYGTRDFVGMMTFIIAGIAGFGMVWFALQQGSGSSVDITSSIPIMLEVLP